MTNITPPSRKDEAAGQQEALDIIKARIRELYGDEPEKQADVDTSQMSLMDRFWHKHKDHPDQQAAWQQFYEGLEDEEKKSLWNEYHSINTPEDTKTKAKPAIKHEKVLEPTKDYGQFKIPGEPEPEPQTEPSKHANEDLSSLNIGHSESFEQPKSKKLKKLANKDAVKAKKEQLIGSVKNRRAASKSLNKKRSKAHWAPLMISLTFGFLMLFAQYNPIVFALAKQYISPGDSLRSPVIIDPNADIEIGDESRIIIPKINVDVPVVYDVETKEESAIQEALERGVVHYDGTSQPGEAGNNVIVGHSSNNFLNSGKYKFAFVLLDRLELNDTFILHHEGVRYVYKVTNKQVIEPTDFSLTLPTETPTATLITCTPPGTSWQRLVVQGEQISPTPTAEQIAPLSEAAVPTDSPEIVPGNSPSLWSRITNWLF